jgi:hypothetical protein
MNKAFKMLLAAMMRARWHQTNFYMAPAQHFAQQRTGGNADGKHHQQQRGHLLVAVQYVFGKSGKQA